MRLRVPAAVTVEVEGRITAPTCLAGLNGSLTGCSRQLKVRRAIAGRVARGFGFRVSRAGFSLGRARRLTSLEAALEALKAGRSTMADDAAQLH